MNFKKIIELSFALSGKHKYGQRCRHFSFIYEKNKLLSIGLNNPKTHPLNLKFNYINKQKHKISHMVGTHSEMNAIIKLGQKNYEDLVLINTRINRKNEIDYSCPCNGCMEMLFSLGFKKVYFTTKNKNFELLIPQKYYKAIEI